MRAGYFRMVVISVAATATLAATTAHAEGLLRLRAGASQTSYDLAFDGGPYKGRSAKSTFAAPGGALSYLAENRFFVDLSGQSANGATHDLWTTPQPFSRSDFAVTAGYLSESDLSVFGGYKSATSGLTAGAGAGFSKETFSSTGPFAGLGYSIAAGPGRLGANVAIAYMLGEWKDDSGFKATAYTLGASYSVTYTYMLARHVGFQADARMQNYSYTFWDATAGNYKVSEKVTALGLGLIVQF